MAALTRQLLDVYRGSVMETPMTSVDMVALAHEMERTHAAALAERGIILMVTENPEHARVHGSRDKLKQVLLNLLLNARDAMPDGGRLTLSLVREDPWLAVRVIDTGTGIAPDHKDHVFDAFFTTKKEVQGVGLGLSVTYGIVKQHKGRIDVESAIGVGTTFTIRLPLEHSDQTLEEA